RHTIISLIEVDSPHIRLAAVKPAADMEKRIRVPNARERKPESGIITTPAMRKAVGTQETSLLLAERPAWISVSEAETIWTSRIAMNMPKTMARKAMRRRGSIRSTTSADAAINSFPLAVGFAVFAIGDLVPIPTC